MFHTSILHFKRFSDGSCTYGNSYNAFTEIHKMKRLIKMKYINAIFHLANCSKNICPRKKVNKKSIKMNEQVNKAIKECDLRSS